MSNARWPESHRVLTPAQVREVRDRVAAQVGAYCEGEGLDRARFEAALEPLWVPVAGWLATLADDRRRAGAPPLILGLAGAQGTGKSTLARLLELLLFGGFGRRCALVSLDDLYLTRAERERLAVEVHPLLRTRGVPGTHDVVLGLQLLDALARHTPGQLVALPRFDKAADDRAPAATWPAVATPVDCILFEGWCLGARPQSEEALGPPHNALERERDPDGVWRRWVCAQLAGDYRALFARLDRLVFLAAPDPAASLAWRIEQEHKLCAHAAAARAVMSDAAVASFVQHFARITEHMAIDLPGRADVVIRLTADHGWTDVVVRANAARGDA